MDNEPQMPRRRLAFGLLVISAVAALVPTSGGLLGAEDSPSASFNGETTTGQTAAD